MQCTHCETANPDQARFCLHCGAQLTAARPLEGERRFVTVLFADVVDSTAMGEHIDPEHVAEIMGGALDVFASAVDRYGGTVARLMGDGVLAIFGAPTAHDDDAERAIRAGLAIQDAARRYADVVRQSHGAEFRVRVGIHSGLAVLTMVGNEIKTEYTAMGDTANLAARLQQVASPGSVLISVDTYHLVQSTFEVRSRGSLQLKGRSQALDAFEVIAARSDSHQQRGVEGMSSPLVGRRQELDLLQDAVRSANTGPGIFVAVTADAGLGKSRLVAEARTRATESTWLEGRGLSYGQAIAYYPWRQIIYTALGASEQERPEDVRARLERDFPGEDRYLIERLLAVESPDAGTILEDLSGAALMQRIADTVRRWLLDMSRRGPLVLVFDDLHWVDQASLDLLMGVSDLVTTAPLTIIAVLRPDRASPSWAVIQELRDRLGDRFRDLRLEPLSGPDAQQLLDNLLEVRDLPDRVRVIILQRSEGNPFFLEEVIRSLIDSAHIVRDADGWRATREISEVTIPETLMGVLAARIDRLPEGTKRVAQTAAVIGRIFQYPVLTATVTRAEVGIDDLALHVGTLTGEELVRERSRQPELEYIFKHALTQEAAYDLLLLKRRKEYHRLVGQVLEQLYPDQADVLAPVLAHHFQRGEDWLQAAHHSISAARGAAQLFAMSEAREHAEQAYAALHRLPDPPMELLVDAILVWVEVAFRTVSHDILIGRLEEAERLARQLDDPRRLALALNWIGSTHASAGFPLRGVQALIEGHRLAAELGDERLSVLPLFGATMAVVDRDPPAAVVQLERVIELAERYREPGIGGHALAVRGMALARLGRLAEAEDALKRAQSLKAQVDIPVTRMDIDVVSALAYLDMGNLERGLELSTQAAARAREVGSTECSMSALYNRGMGELRKPNVQEAQAAFQEALMFTPAGSEVMRYLPQAGLAMAQARLNAPEAQEALEAARLSAEAVGDEFMAAALETDLGRTLLRQGNFALAEGHLGRAIAYYRRTDMIPYLVSVLPVLAELQDRQGQNATSAETRAETAHLRRELSRRASAPGPHLAAS